MAHGDNQEKSLNYMTGQPIAGPSQSENVISVNLNEGRKFYTCCCYCCQCEVGYPSRHSRDIGRKPIHQTCPNCRMAVHTQRKFVPTRRTNLIALLLLPTGCCLLPYLFKMCKDVRHYCPICNAYIGTAKF